jgi:hypothetical protein
MPLNAHGLASEEQVDHLRRLSPGCPCGELSGRERMTVSTWTVETLGLGDFSEVYSEELQTWVRAIKRVRRRDGQVSATGPTESGERVTVMMPIGSTGTVRYAGCTDDT